MPEKVIGDIIESTNYEKFVLMEDKNRPIDRKHVESLKQKMHQKYILAPAMVDRKNRIIDGQHRYLAAKELGLPFRYYISENLSAEQIASLNNASKKWSNTDYANTYANQGNQNYVLYKRFVTMFPMFSHSVVMVLLTNSATRNSHLDEKFRMGDFRVKSWTKAVSLAEKLVKIGEYYRGFNRRSFVFAVIRMTEVEGFNFDRLYRKLSMKAPLLGNYAQTEDFLRVLQEIYNYKERDRLMFTSI